MILQTDAECDYLVKLAKPNMVKSTVVDSATGRSKDSRWVVLSCFMKGIPVFGLDMRVSSIEGAQQYNGATISHFSFWFWSSGNRVRTSSGTFLNRGQDAVITGIEEKIAQFTLIPVGMSLLEPVSWSVSFIYRTFILGGMERIELIVLPFSFFGTDHGEGLQVLHYEVGQKYEAHYDYFHDSFNTQNGGQRIATVLMYL